ncbi:transcriptional regulator [Ktedonobacter sp. SOSP1-52]|uniref:DUF3267 domain-containing protein n=1 Tax=Ktedonobacter sp. SOSP1-52 TaxID=2778366 RepID=UPI0019160AF7|nr:DUF3267 domain-containing protein [Ktedonobacter sp. SOSP1-52]GHO67564.1 transcriptional regulator [Ktedonobacter sp. SOSP1-52]
MKAVTSLPQGYTPCGEVNFAKDKKLAWILNGVGLLLFILFALAFAYIAFLFHRESLGRSASVTIGGWQLLEGILAMAFTVFGCMLVHELIHGVFFWVFTQAWPHFGFKWIYAYASAPEWYIPRTPFLIIGLAPFLLVTLIGVAVLPFASLGLSLFLWLLLTLNAAGSVGDFYVIIRLLFAPSPLLVHDYGDGMTWYRAI